MPRKKVPHSNSTGSGISKRHSIFHRGNPVIHDNQNASDSVDVASSQDGRMDSRAVPSATKSTSTNPRSSTSELPSTNGSGQLDAIDVNANRRPNRFSLLRLRHASDPQLSKSYTSSRRSLTPPPPQPPTPMIITTAPTATALGDGLSSKRKHKPNLPTRPQMPTESNLPLARCKTIADIPRASESSNRSTPFMPTDMTSVQSFSPNVPAEPSTRFTGPSPPAYGDVSGTSLALPPSRLSESSKSDASSGEHRIYAETTTTHTVSTTTTFFKLPRRKKEKRGSLFPLPVKIPPPDGRTDAHWASGSSSPKRSSLSPARRGADGQGVPEGPGPSQESSLGRGNATPSPSHSTVSFANAPPPSPGMLFHRQNSVLSRRSAKSSKSVPARPPLLGHRRRSSTATSLQRTHEVSRQSSPPPLISSARTSTSTVGRRSFGDIFSISQKFRQHSEPAKLAKGKATSGLPGTPASTNSKANSLQMPREPFVYPERTPDDNPATYLSKLEEAVNRGVIAAILCQKSDDFAKTCLRKYMRGFSYFGDSIDMAVRKMLMEVELPKETQQIDRLLQGFADRYCECNPGIFVATDEAYFVAFSILLLHSDTHNKNNRHKMQKADYVKNTQDQVEVSQDILGCFYDNISYTPFIHFEDEIATNSHRLAAPKPRKGLFKSSSTDNVRSPVDPYALILDQKLEVLRPPLKDVMNTEDSYSCTGTMPSLDASHLHEAFHKAAVLQIVSARSRPDAFLSQATISNPAEAQVGLVDIKAAKVGLLWRKEPKKKKTRSPWQEWGALLTGSQLYFFRDVAWIKSLMYQYEAHHKAESGDRPVTFKPPLSSFQPDALLSMDDTVALLDAGYKRHKHAFLFIKHGGFEEVFLANSEEDMNDWIAKINYAASFRTIGVPMRGFVGANHHGQRPILGRNRSGTSEKSHTLPTDGRNQQGGQNDQELEGEIRAYRRQVMGAKIGEANNKLISMQKELDNLLRNARHLQLCTPLQGKTREALVLAAGRMAAQLKWTRVDMWRIKGHRDVMKMDLEQELDSSPTLASTARSSLSIRSMARKRSQLAVGSQSTRKLDAGNTISDLPASPKSVKSVFSADSALHATVGVGGGGGGVIAAAARNRPEAASLVSPPSQRSESRERHPSNASIDQVTTDVEASPEKRHRAPSAAVQAAHVAPTHSHQRSASSSAFGRDDTDSVVPESLVTTSPMAIDDEERMMLWEAGLLDNDPQLPALSRPRPGTSESDAEGNILNATTEQFSPPPPLPPSSSLRDRDRVGMRRSLQRTLREAPPNPQTSQSLRQRRGRDTALHSSPAAAVRRSSHSGGEGLARQAGSFTLHGKKASVVTFGSEWQSMLPDEHMKLRRQDHVGRDQSNEDGTESGPSKEEGCRTSCGSGSSAKPQDSTSLHVDGGGSSTTGTLPNGTLGRDPHAKGMEPCSDDERAAEQTMDSGSAGLAAEASSAEAPSISVVSATPTWSGGFGQRDAAAAAAAAVDAGGQEALDNDRLRATDSEVEVESDSDSIYDSLSRRLRGEHTAASGQGEGHGGGEAWPKATTTEGQMVASPPARVPA